MSALSSPMGDLVRRAAGVDRLEAKLQAKTAALRVRLDEELVPAQRAIDELLAAVAALRAEMKQGQERQTYLENQLEQFRGLGPRLEWVEQFGTALSQLPYFLQRLEQPDPAQPQLQDALLRLEQQAAEIAQLRADLDRVTPGEPGLAVIGASPARLDYETWRPGEGHIRLLFVFQHASVWASWRSVYHACATDPRFAVTVVLCPFLHEHGGLAAHEAARALLLEENIPFHQAGFYDVAAARPHVAFLQNPYDDTRPTPFTARGLAAAGCRVAYIPYGLEMGGGAANLRWQFDLELHRGAWRIFARSDRHRRMYARYCASGNAHVVTTGHPKFDVPRDLPRGALATAVAAKAAGRPVLLWAPHFTVGQPPGWSTFSLYSEGILAFARERPDLFLLIRPHPMFWSSMAAHGLWDAAAEQAFRASIEASDNMALDETAGYYDAFEVASVLLADGGSFLLEFLPTGKPVVYLHNPDGPGLNDDGEVTEGYYAIRAAADIAPVLRTVVDQGDPMRERRLRMVEEFLFRVDGQAGARIRDHIVAALADGDPMPLRGQEQRSETQHAAAAFWKGARTSYLAAPEYYAVKERVLREWLAEANPRGRMLDLGCSDGRYTAVISRHASAVIGMDISPALIEQARQRQDYAPGCEVELVVADLEDHVPFGTFDAIFCMGVASCLPSDVAYVRLADRLALLAAAGGWLVLVDTVSLGGSRRHVSAEGYVSTYRNEAEYLAVLTARGFVPVWERMLSEDAPQRLVNRFRVFRRN